MSDKIFIEYQVNTAQLQADQKAIRDEMKATEQAGVKSQENVQKAAESASAASVKAKKSESEAVKQLKAQLAEIAEVQKKLNDQAKDTAPGKARQELNKRIAETKFEYQEVQKELDKTLKAEQALTPPVESLKKQLRQLKEQLALATDPKEVERLARAVGKLEDQIGDAKDQARIFASDSKFEQVGTALGDVGTKLRNLDFAGAAQQSQLLVQVVRSFSVKDAIEGVKDLGTTFLNLGKALLLNPIFLVAAALTAIGVAAYSVGKAIYEVNVQTITVTESLAAGRKAMQDYADRFTEAQIKIKESLGIVSKAQADALRANVNFNKESRTLNAAHSDAILKLAKELDLDLRTLDEKGNATRLVRGGTYNAANLLLIERFNKEKAKLDTDFERQQTALRSDQAQERLGAEIADNVARGKAAQDYINKINAEKLAAEKKLNDDLIKEQQRLQQVLRDLRTANIENDYQREKQIIRDQYADRLASDGKNASIRKELAIKLNNDLSKVDEKYFGDKLTTENNNLTASQDAQINAAYQKIDLNAKTNSKILEQDIKAAEESARQTTAIRQAAFQAIAASITSLQEIYNNIEEQKQIENETRSEEDRKRIKEDYDQGLISKEDYEKGVEVINARAAAKERELKEKQFNTNKTIAIIQSYISTAQGVAGALAQTEQLGYAAFVLAALVAATGLAQVVAIQSQPTPKFGKGGKVGGKLHSEGGEIIEAEKDEWVINRRSSIQNDKLLRAINMGREKEFIKEVYIAPALKAHIKRHEQHKQEMFSSELIKSIESTGKFYDGNLLDSMKATRRAERENTMTIVKAFTSNKRGFDRNR